MAWFSNMTLKGKLLFGFITVAIIAGLIGGYGIYNIRLLDAADTKLYEKMTVPLGQMAEISIAFQRVRVNIRGLIDATTPDKQEHFAGRIKEFRETIEKNIASYEKTILTDEGRKLFDEFKKSRVGYGAALEKMMTLAKEGKANEATALMEGEGGKAARDEQNAIDKLMDSKIEIAKQTSEENSAAAHTTNTVMSTLSILGVIMAIGLGLIIARIVLRQLGGDPKKVGEIANVIAAGDLSREVRTTGKAGGLKDCEPLKAVY